jgi:hypothetical protein
LSANTTYYVRAYARNAYTLSYGEEKSFSTLPPSPDQSRDLVFSGISANKMEVGWTNGTGTSRIVKINTQNIFTIPADGTDPVADPVYAGSGEQIVYNGSASQVSVTGLSSETRYYYHVFDYTGTGGSTVYDPGPGINNPASSLTYCEPSYSNEDVGTHFKRVILNTIDNVSGASHYSDFTDLTSPMLTGSEYELEVEMSYNSLYVNVWIDFDDDLVFETGEQLVDDFLCPPNTLTSISFNLPVNTPLGKHTLRVRGAYNPGVEPCNTKGWGETEDYSVDLKEVISWTGSLDTDWFDPANWDVGIVPSASTEVIIENAVNLPSIGVGMQAFGKKLTVKPGADLEIAGSLEIAD